MKAVTWHGKRDVRVEQVPDPAIQEPNDIVIRVTSSGICGSDLHLYEVLGPFMTEGDILGHEPIGTVVEVGPAITNVRVGDRVVIPFNIACGHCFMCTRGLPTQCETTQVHAHGKGAALFGYTSLYGAVPGGQAEYLRVPQAQFGPIVVPEGPPDDRFVYLSDVVPTAWHAVGMEAHGAPAGKLAQQMAGLLPDTVQAKLMEKAGVDRLAAFDLAVDMVRRGGTISLSGVYGGMADPVPMMVLFDKQVQLRMGQANVRRWLDDIMPAVLGAADPLGVETFATHRVPLDDAPRMYENFQEKKDGTIKVLLQP